MKNVWLYELIEMRMSNASNVFFLETSDPKRIDQIIMFFSRSEIHPFKKEIVYTKNGKEIKLTFLPRYQIYVDLRVPYEVRSLNIYDSKRGKLTQEHEDINKLQRGGMILDFESFLNILSRAPTIVIIDGVYKIEQARMMEDFLLKVSTQNVFYNPIRIKDISTYPIIISENNISIEEIVEILGDRLIMPSSVIVITSNLELFNRTVRERSVEITIPPSSDDERRTLIERIIEKHRDLIKRSGKSIDENLIELAVISTAGLDLHNTETAILLSLYKKRTIDVSLISQIKKDILSKYNLEYIEPQRGFETVGGYGPVKRFLRENIIEFYRNPEEYAKYGIEAPRGILLFGPPGTGKTWISKAFAKEIGLPMIKVTASNILRGIVGESERLARELTKIFESLAPIVVFIDEADQLFRSRASYVATDSGVYQRVQNILLDWLGDENRKSFVILATNYLQQLDIASIRSGRINYAVPILYPDRESRVEILKLHTEVLNKPRVQVNVDYNEISTRTSLFSSADLSNLVREAKIIAFNEKSPIKTEHFLKALSRIRVNIDENEKIVSNVIEEARSMPNIIIPEDLFEYARRILNERRREKEEVYRKIE